MSIPVYPLPENFSNPRGDKVSVAMLGESGAVLVSSAGDFYGPVGPFDTVAMVNECAEHGPEHGEVLGIEFLAAPSFVEPIDLIEWLTPYLGAEEAEACDGYLDLAIQTAIDSLVGEFDPDELL